MNTSLTIFAVSGVFLTACASSGAPAHDESMPETTGIHIVSAPHDPGTAPHAAVDRFSDAAAQLFRRSANPSLPGPNVPIDFDSGPPLFTDGLGPQGQHVRYYNFDVQPAAPGVLFRFVDAHGAPVAGQLDILDVIPGDAGYSDFVTLETVTVPAGYVANTLASPSEIMASGYPLQKTTTILNRVVVPIGSTANLRWNNAPSATETAWYRDQIVGVLAFDEAMLDGNTTPAAPIYVTFNKNPDPNDPTSGPASGFKMESGSIQVHNVVVALPDSPAYSPLWSVDVYDNADFADVHDLPSASRAHILARGVATVNCPVVSML